MEGGSTAVDVANVGCATDVDFFSYSIGCRSFFTRLWTKIVSPQ